MKNYFFRIFLIAFALGYSIPGIPQELAANKQVVMRYFDEVINNRKIELLRTIFSEDYFFHSLEDGSETRGLKHLDAFLPVFFRAFPDIHYSVDQIVAEGDQVVVQCTATGTQKGDFWAYPASNNKIKIAEVFFMTVKEGKIVAGRRLVDLLHLDKQLKGIN